MITQMTRAGAMVLLLVATLYPGAAAAHEGTDLEVPRVRARVTATANPQSHHSRPSI